MRWYKDWYKDCTFTPHGSDKPIPIEEVVSVEVEPACAVRYRQAATGQWTTVELPVRYAFKRYKIGEMLCRLDEYESVDCNGVRTLADELIALLCKRESE